MHKKPQILLKCVMNDCWADSEIIESLNKYTIIESKYKAKVKSETLRILSIRK